MLRDDSLIVGNSPLFHASSAVLSSKTGKNGHIRGLRTQLGMGPPYHPGLCHCPPKAGQDTAKVSPNMAFITSGECEALNPSSEKNTEITSVK